MDFSRYAFNERFIRDLPRRPGVYSMYDAEGRLLYVGKTKNLRSRVGSYFRGLEDRPRKTTRLLDSLYSLECRPVGSDLEAQLIEARLIRSLCPEVNTQVEVRSRSHLQRVPPEVLAILPSADPDSAELFIVREDRPVRQVRIRRDLTNMREVRRILRDVLDAPPAELTEDEIADVLLVRGHLGRHRDAVRRIDLREPGGFNPLIEKVKQEVEDLEPVV